MAARAELVGLRAEPHGLHPTVGGVDEEVGVVGVPGLVGAKGFAAESGFWAIPDACARALDASIEEGLTLDGVAGILLGDLSLDPGLLGGGVGEHRESSSGGTFRWSPALEGHLRGIEGWA